jgi:glycosyltransferase involved in cell wall biosynthesis
MLKIGFITHSAYPVIVGGSELSVFYLARELAKRGHDVTIFSFDSLSGIVNEEIEGVNFERFPQKMMNNFPKLLFLFANKRFNEFDIIHFYGQMLFLQSYKIKLLNDVKTVATLNYYLIACPSTYAMKNGRACNTCSYSDLLKCGIRNAPCRNSLLSILTRACKGVDILIRALPMVKNKVKDFKCYIIGSGDSSHELREMVTDLGLSNLVEFTGFLSHDKLKDYYLKSEIFVFPVIWHEPFGRSLLEAMNYGLPVIASENIEHEIIGDAGLIYRNNDPNELAEKIIYLFENEKERKKLSHNAKKKIVDYYPERIVPKVEDLYNYIVR